MSRDLVQDKFIELNTATDAKTLNTAIDVLGPDNTTIVNSDTLSSA